MMNQCRMTLGIRHKKEWKIHKNTYNVIPQFSYVPFLNVISLFFIGFWCKIEVEKSAYDKSNGGNIFVK